MAVHPVIGTEEYVPWFVGRQRHPATGIIAMPVTNPRPSIGRLEHRRRPGLEAHRHVTELLGVGGHVPVEQLVSLLVHRCHLRPPTMNVQSTYTTTAPLPLQLPKLVVVTGRGPIPHIVRDAVSRRDAPQRTDR